MSAIKFEINGEMVDPDDASWYEIAPCGCACGVMSAQSGPDLYVDEESVWKHIFPNKTQRERTKKQGFRQVLGLRKDCVELLGTECPHTPKYGVERTPLIEGHKWAREDGLHIGRRKHQVFGDFDKHDRLFSFDPKVSALCGRESSSWGGAWHHVDGLPECTRCAKEAKKRAAGNAAVSS